MSAGEDLDTTVSRALTEAERASIESATEAHKRGDIAQEEIGPGVWRLKGRARSSETPA